MVGNQQTHKPVGCFSPYGDRIRAVELRDSTCIVYQTRHPRIRGLWLMEGIYFPQGDIKLIQVTGLLVQ